MLVNSDAKRNYTDMSELWILEFCIILEDPKCKHKAPYGRDTGISDRGEGDGGQKQREERLCDVEMQAEECGWPPEAGKGEELILL